MTLTPRTKHCTEIGQCIHQPLNRQSERFGREGIGLCLSTLADLAGAGVTALQPPRDLIKTHVMVATRLHGNDTKAPAMAKDKTDAGRIWVYVRDDRPFDGEAASAAIFYYSRYSRDRCDELRKKYLEHFAGILQADFFASYNHLYAADRRSRSVTRTLCRAHRRRKFYALAAITGNAAKGRYGKISPPISPLALEAVKRIDAILDVEHEINGNHPDERLAGRREYVAPPVAEFETWMRTERPRLSRRNDIAKAMDHMLTRWDGVNPFPGRRRRLNDKRCGQRALRGIALTRSNCSFWGADRSGQRAAVMPTLIVIAKMNDINPQAWLADILVRIADTSKNRLHELPPRE